MNKYILHAIYDEQDRQLEKHGDKKEKSAEYWHLILSEEVGEVAETILDKDNFFLKRELIHVVAVCISWLETLE